VLDRGGALASAKFAYGVQPCSEPQCSAAALPSSTSIDAGGEAQVAVLSASERKKERASGRVAGALSF